MRKKVLSFLLALLVLLPAFPLSAGAREEKGMISYMVELVNEERKAAGAAVLSDRYEKLNRAAETRAKEIAKLFSHVRPNGKDCFSAVEETGLTYHALGENIAYNFGFSDTVREALRGWMSSPGHRANLLNPDFTAVGTAVWEYGGAYYWVQIFASGLPASEESETQEEEPEAPGAYPGTPFTDIGDHWGRDAIRWTYSQGLFSGVSETAFGPEKQMDRGMLAVVLHRYAGEPAAGESVPYSDVSPGAYYAAAVAWASEKEIVTGTGNNRYSPRSNVTREQMALMLYRTRKLTAEPAARGDLNVFSDRDKISPWAREAVSWAVGEGILTGKSQGRLDPGGTATRAQVAAMLQRFAGG